MPSYKLRVSERRAVPHPNYPERTEDYSLLDMEVVLEAFDFRKLLALLLEMLYEPVTRES